MSTGQHRTLLLTALAASGFVIIASYLILFNLYGEMCNLSNEVEVGMDEFRILADRAWNELMSAPRSLPKLSGSPARIRRGVKAAGGVIVAAEAVASPGYGEQTRTVVVADCPVVQCPAGEPGMPGANGEPGVPGLDGEDGAPGNHGVFIQEGCQAMYCEPCPQGPVGQPGVRGSSGGTGPTGMPGYPGIPGMPGIPGAPGHPGDPGQPGFNGGYGHRGEPGRPGQQYTIEYGPKGPPGTPGRPGNNGIPGANAEPGYMGLPGWPGPAGQPGIPGQNGQPGFPGLPGIPGGDIGYCPCPTPTGNRNAPVQQTSYAGQTAAQPEKVVVLRESPVQPEISIQPVQAQAVVSPPEDFSGADQSDGGEIERKKGRKALERVVLAERRAAAAQQAAQRRRGRQ